MCMLFLLIMASGVSVQAANKKKAYISFYSNSGKLIETEYVTNGKKKLPALKNRPGYTFMGWSTEPKQRSDPQYQAGEVIRVTGKKKLYAVEFDRRREVNIPAAELPKPDSRKYAGVIFVGDSRTYMLRKLIEEECSWVQRKRLAFVCRSGQGISWFNEVGKKQLFREISKAKKEYPGKKVAVVFNLGVNDLCHRNGLDPDYRRIADIYARYMNELSKSLVKSGCQLYYMSVNPINGTMSLTEGLRREEEIRGFNECLKARLNRNFTFLNTYDSLMKNGYSTQRSFEDDLRDDGIHYTKSTYKRIYRYCMNKLNKM